ncbi:MAG TPA: YceI family protein [Terriglobales bacterium]|nr:YceI family protein [Terriglobales bacterium]
MTAFCKFAASLITSALARVTLEIFLPLTLFVLPFAGTLLMTAAHAQSGPITNPEPASDELSKAETMVIEHGTVTFVVTTNVPGLSVKGKSEALHARVLMHRAQQGVTLERVEAWLPVKTMTTGIALRDQHMRQDIFTASGADVPDLHFEAGNASCAGVVAGHEAPCTVSGNLTIRGVPHDFAMALKIHEGATAPLLRASGDGLVKLSDYGIEAPTQFGVKTANEVHVHIEFPETAATAETGGAR